MNRQRPSTASRWLSIAVTVAVVLVVGAGDQGDVPPVRSAAAARESAAVATPTPGPVPTSVPTRSPSAPVTPPVTPPPFTSPVTPTPSESPAPRSFTIVATGDVLLHERLWFQAQRDARAGDDMNFAPQLASIAPIVTDADLAICHLETPVGPSGGPYSGYPLFAVPPQIVTGLAETGYDVCTTASNHTFDAGASGVDRTLDALDAAGVDHAGSARTAAEAKEPMLVEVAAGGGATTTVAMLSYTYGFNGLPYPDGERWRSPLIDEDVVLADAAAARSAGAEFVVVALHWGTEYVHEPNDDQLRLAPRFLASEDIDLLLGHHAHVVQPVENIDGEWVAYGMGNLMSAHRRPEAARSEGLLLRFTVTERSPGAFATTAVEYLPLLQTDAMPVGVVDVPAALDGGHHGTATTSRLAAALDRTVEVVTSRGGADDGLTLLQNATR